MGSKAGSILMSLNSARSTKAPQMFSAQGGVASPYYIPHLISLHVAQNPHHAAIAANPFDGSTAIATRNGRFSGADTYGDTSQDY